MSNILKVLKFNRSRYSTKGFTLVELVAVMMIIGFIMAISLPRYFSRQTYEGKGYFEKALNLFYFSQKVAMARGPMPYEDDNFLKVNNVNFYPKASNEGYIQDVYMYIVPKVDGSTSTDGTQGTFETFFADRYAGCTNGIITATKPSDFSNPKAVIPTGSGLNATELNNGSGTTFRLQPQNNSDISAIRIRYLRYSTVSNLRTDYEFDSEVTTPLLFKFDAEGRPVDACNNPITKILDIVFKVESGQRGSYYHIVMNPDTGFVHPGRFNSLENTYGSQVNCKIKTGGAPDDCK